MLDLNTVRHWLADQLQADHGRFSLDRAIAHVVEKAYQQGIEDGIEEAGRKARIPDSPQSHATP